MNADELLVYARKGAQAQLERILTVFPDLRHEMPQIVKPTKRTYKRRTRRHWTQTAAGRRYFAQRRRAK